MARGGEDLEEHRAAQLIEQISCPTFAGLHAAGHVESMGKDAALHAFKQAIGAACAVQRARIVPSDAELERRGGPPTDTMARLMKLADLSGLPGGQLCAAVEAGIVPAPDRLIVEARTERSVGPDKFGVAHIKPPPTLLELDPAHAPLASRASNTTGGIASVLVLADCGGLIVPVGAVPIAQEHWDPAHWRREYREEAERRLRARGEVDGPFVTTPAEIAIAIVALLRSARTVTEWGQNLIDLPILGGRLRVGFPLTGAGVGAGNRERYVGCCLTALGVLGASDLIPFLSLPAAPAVSAALSCSYEECQWRFEVGEENIDLRSLEAGLRAEASLWEAAPERLTRRIGRADRRVFTLSLTALAENISERVTMVATVDRSARRELFVTSLDPREASELAQIVELADFEIERRRPDSPLEVTIDDLLDRSHLQSNPRRRHPGRRNFAGLAQAAQTVRTFARVA